MTFHVIPRRAFVGHISTQILQSPHCGSTGALLIVANGAVVKTLPNSTAQPYWSVTSRLFLPMNPNPALSTTVL